MDGNKIGLGNNFFERPRLHAHARDVFGGNERIVADHPHFQAGGSLRDDTPDVAEADDTDGLVAELDADKFVAVPLAAF